MKQVTITIHLGTGLLGQVRKQALEALASRTGHIYNNQPSIGRWLISQADAWIDETETNIQQAKGTKS